MTVRVKPVFAAAKPVRVDPPELAVDALRPEEMKLLLELGSVRRAGTYTLPTRPDSIPGVMVLDWDPKEVTVGVVASGK